MTVPANDGKIDSSPLDSTYKQPSKECGARQGQQNVTNTRLALRHEQLHVQQAKSKVKLEHGWRCSHNIHQSPCAASRMHWTCSVTWHLPSTRPYPYRGATCLAASQTTCLAPMTKTCTPLPEQLPAWTVGQLLRIALGGTLSAVAANCTKLTVCLVPASDCSTRWQVLVLDCWCCCLPEQ